MNGLEDKEFEDIFGFWEKYESNRYADDIRWEYVYYHDLHYGADITGFSKLYTVNGKGIYNSDEDNDAVGFLISGARIPFDFTAEAERLYGLYGPDASGVQMTYELESGRLLLTSIDFQVSGDEFVVNSYEGYYLER